MGGVFIVTHSIHLSPKSVERRAREYLAHQENIEPEVRELALAAVKAQQKNLTGLLKARRSFPGITALEQPSIFFDLISINLQDTKEYTSQVMELSMQALIYGEFDHFIGHKDAFSFAHEYGHRIMRGFESGKALEALAYDSHVWLGKLAIIEELSPEQIDELWEGFEKTRESIDDLVQRFEPIEEIFATYAGLRFLPVDARNKVEPLVKEALIKKGWGKVYEAFAEMCDAFDDPLAIAASICEHACLVLLNVIIDGKELLRIFLEIHKVIWFTIDIILDKEQKEGNILDRLGVEDSIDLPAIAERLAGESINLLLDNADIPRELYWFVSQKLHDIQKEKSTLITEASRNNDFSDLKHKLGGCGAKIVLIGSPAAEFISYSVQSCEHEETDKLPPDQRIFFESLAEQILTKSCNLVCPNGSINVRKKCCGRREWFERLYERLPEKYKKHISLPNCVRVR